MLANGTLLGFKVHGSTGAAYTDFPGLKTLPDMTNSREKVENTPINAANKRYELGTGDLGDMEYTFVHDKNSPDSAYRMLRNASDSNEVLDFQETWPDGTRMQYSAIPSVGFTRGGGVNSVIDLKVQMAIQSDMEVIDPEEV